MNHQELRPDIWNNLIETKKKKIKINMNHILKHQLMILNV